TRIVIAVWTWLSRITRRSRWREEETTTAASGSTARRTSRITDLATSPTRMALTPPAVDDAMPPSARASSRMAGATSPQSVTKSRDAFTVNPVLVWADTRLKTPLRNRCTGSVNVPARGEPEQQQPGGHGAGDREGAGLEALEQRASPAA